jgi:hypothetical protein
MPTPPEELMQLSTNFCPVTHDTSLAATLNQYQQARSTLGASMPLLINQLAQPPHTLVIDAMPKLPRIAEKPAARNGPVYTLLVAMPPPKVSSA